MKIEELFVIGNKILKENNIEDYILKNRLLLSSILEKSKEHLMIHNEDEVELEKEKIYIEKIEKLKLGIPIQYLINKQEFMGLEFFVNENVLIPQPDTEILVQDVIEKVEDNFQILDLCTGSGAIGISIAKLNQSKNVKVCLSDISEKALYVAKKNCEKNEVNVKLIQSDLFENIDEKFDIIVSNPPYIETKVIDTLSKEVKCEPILALDGGKDGLDFYRVISKRAKEYFKPEGILELEIGYNQKESVIEILKNDGYKNIYSKKDYNNLDRIVVGIRGE